MSGRTVILAEPPTVTGVGVLAPFARPLRPVLQSDGSVVFRWWKIQLDPSAIPNTSTVTAELAVIDPGSRLKERRSLAPARLVGQSFGVGDFVWMGDGLGLVYTQTSSAPDQRDSETALLYFLEGPKVFGAFPEGECVDCSFEWASAFFEGRLVVAYARHTRPSQEQDSELRFAVISPSGALLSSGSLGPVVETSVIGGRARFELVADRDILLLKTSHFVMRIDSSFEVLEGPLPYSGLDLPAVAWSGDRATLAWTKKVLTPESSRNGDLFVQTLAHDGTPVTEVSRLSTASQIEDLRSFRDGHAVAFSDGLATYFAITSPDGDKVGGDLPLDVPSNEAAQLFSARRGLLVPRSTSILELIHLTHEGIEAVEVSCDR